MGQDGSFSCDFLDLQSRPLGLERTLDDGRQTDENEGQESNSLSSATRQRGYSMRPRKSNDKVQSENSLKNNSRLPTRPHSVPIRNDSKPHSPQKHLPEVEIHFAELEDGSLAEMVEDPADPTRSVSPCTGTESCNTQSGGWIGIGFSFRFRGQTCC